MIKQKDSLLEKLTDFEATNRALRRLLREQHQAETAAIRLGEQRDLLMRRLSEADRFNEVCYALLMNLFFSFKNTANINYISVYLYSCVLHVLVSTVLSYYVEKFCM